MVIINEALCTGCGKCAEDCIAKCITVTEGKAHARRHCLNCGHCVAVCPANAVSIPEYEMSDVEPFCESSFTLNPEAVLHSIKFRRSIRDYVQKPVEQEKLYRILQAGRYTATAKNNQGSCFIFIQNELETLKTHIWNYISEAAAAQKIPRDMLPFASFYKRKKENPDDDFLFRNAPVVVYITSDWPLDAGLAAQNMETMAVSQGLGVLYNGYLAGITERCGAVKSWLGIGDKTIKACMLLGYPNVTYQRTAPRAEANVIWK